MHLEILRRCVEDMNSHLCTKYITSSTSSQSSFMIKYYQWSYILSAFALKKGFFLSIYFLIALNSNGFDPDRHAYVFRTSCTWLPFLIGQVCSQVWWRQDSNERRVDRFSFIMSNILCQRVFFHVSTEQLGISKSIWIKCLLETNLASSVKPSIRILEPLHVHIVHKAFISYWSSVFSSLV